MSRAAIIAATRPWAIEEEWLSAILDVARDAAREGEAADEFKAVAAKVGRPVEGGRRLTMRGDVATLAVIGPIFRYSTFLSAISGASSVQVLQTDLQIALEDPKVSAIVLEIDSPGGEVTGIAEFAASVYQARQTKPIYAYVGGWGASAAYWIASAAQEIIIAPTSLLGSIGVLMVHPDGKTSGQVAFISSQSPNKKPDPRSEEGAAVFQQRVDDLASVFVSDVARYRGVAEEVVTSDFGKGGVLVGRHAVEAGLADRLGSYEGLLAELGVRDAAGAPSRIIVSGGTSPPVLAEDAREEGGKEHRMAEAQKKPSLKERFLALFEGDDEEEKAKAGDPVPTAAQLEETRRLQERIARMEQERAEEQQERIRVQAVQFFAGALRENRALPCQQAAAESLFAQLAADDLANPVKVLVGDREVSRVEAFQAFAADGPTHDLTAELLPAAGGNHLPAGALALPNREETPDPRKPKEPTEERTDSLLDMTPLGQAVARERNGRAK